MRKFAAALLAAVFLLFAGCTVVPAFAPGEEASPASSGVSGAPEDPESTPAPPAEEDTTVRVTIPEGFTVLQICQRLEENGVCSGQEFF
ncbi:MAG TPA: hypothetical protein IAD03_03840, partial [Candidatus Caccousia stercoris]|nr:hypothetical protein [Candidatus Caccousia stercoris]